MTEQGLTPRRTPVTWLHLGGTDRKDLQGSERVGGHLTNLISHGALRGGEPSPSPRERRLGYETANRPLRSL